MPCLKIFKTVLQQILVCSLLISCTAEIDRYADIKFPAKGRKKVWIVINDNACLACSKAYIEFLDTMGTDRLKDVGFYINASTAILDVSFLLDSPLSGSAVFHHQTTGGPLDTLSTSFVIYKNDLVDTVVYITAEGIDNQFLYLNNNL